MFCLNHRFNTALEPAATVPSVSDVPGKSKVGDESTLDSGGGDSAFER